MERGKKMVIVPEEALHRMQNAHNSAPAAAVTLQQDSKISHIDDQEKSVQTPGDNLSRLDAEMHEILYSKKFTDAREKCKNYLQVLRRFLFFKEAERVEVAEEEKNTVEADSPITIDAILENISLVNRRKARLLLDHWRASNRFTWDLEGTVILDGRKIQNSNIVELLNSVLTKSKRRNTRGREEGGVEGEEEEEQDGVPVGQIEFARFVKSVDTPVNLIVNRDILKIGQKLVAKRRLPVAAQSTPLQTRAGVAKKRWIKLDI